MAVIKEYRCLAHGAFESDKEVCPHGCETVVREFRSAPGTRSDKTKSSDKTLEALASRFGLTDMSNRNGESIGGNRKHADGMAAVWGELPKGNNYEVGKGEVQRDGSQGGAEGILASMGMNANEAQIQQMAKDAGVSMPTFTSVTKALPKVRPIVGKGLSFGTDADLSAAIERAPQ